MYEEYKVNRDTLYISALHFDYKATLKNCYNLQKNYVQFTLYLFEIRT